jgi:hypothetical protein
VAQKYGKPSQVTENSSQWNFQNGGYIFGGVFYFPPGIDGKPHCAVSIGYYSPAEAKILHHKEGDF